VLLFEAHTRDLLLTVASAGGRINGSGSRGQGESGRYDQVLRRQFGDRRVAEPEKTGVAAGAHQVECVLYAAWPLERRGQARLTPTGPPAPSTGP
jgi:hypothetical protein